MKKNECKQVHGQLRRTLHIPILYTAPVEPPVADVVLDRVCAVVQFELQRRVRDADVLLAEVQLQLVPKQDRALRMEEDCDKSLGKTEQIC